MKKIIFTIMGIFALTLGACAPQPAAAPEAESQAKAESASLRVLAANSFLADIAQNVAGDRVTVDSLIPIGLDPHAFEPTPQDVAKIADSQMLIINGAGFEEWIEETISNAGGNTKIVEASAGLAMREASEAEPSHEHEGEEADEHEGEEHDEHHHEGDPHFWLDPNQVIVYAENIRDGLSEIDPAGKDTYAKNAAGYIGQLRELDTWIRAQVEQIPVERRVLVTDHDTLGYFAEQYGFSVTGAIIPSFSSGASPSAQELAGLIDQINDTGAPAIFLDVAANPKLAEQIAAETGVTVVADLHTHSVTAAGGPAATYIEMMRHNTLRIVNALK
ncbi:MAG: metal ABC transporter substrate-binding protein [Anaerolineae bacterium]|nr:metal ABC transporter substrate-binding protein [Anaerolineae bacterium]